MEFEIDYLELAKEVFLELQKQLQTDDNDSIGGKSSKDFYINGFRFEIFVCGFWEKNKFFEYKAVDENRNILYKGNYCF